MLASDEYRHQARRLRQRYTGQPGMLQYSLSELSRRHDQACPAVGPMRHLVEESNPGEPGVEKVTAVPARPGIKNGPDAAFARAVVDWYSEQVAGQLTGDLLHQSQRQELLKTAERLGIGRFHANLIFAMAQHKAEPKPRDTWRIVPKSQRISAFAIFAIAQAVIILAGWSLLHFG